MIPWPSQQWNQDYGVQVYALTAASSLFPLKGGWDVHNLASVGTVDFVPRRRTTLQDCPNLMCRALETRQAWHTLSKTEQGELQANLVGLFLECWYSFHEFFGGRFYLLIFVESALLLALCWDCKLKTEDEVLGWSFAYSIKTYADTARFCLL